jgi:hypothetical protein
MAVVLYCKGSDLDDRLSAAGVARRADDDARVTASILRRAATRVNFYLLPQYTADQLVLSEWVRERTADVAAYMHATYRGNPAPLPIKMESDMALAELESIRLGQARVPDVSARKAQVPVLSQPRADLFPIPRTVIERGRSTGSPDGYSRRDDPFEPPVD